MFIKGDELLSFSRTPVIVQEVISEISFKGGDRNIWHLSNIKGFKDKKLEKERVKEFYEKYKDLVISPEAVLKIAKEVYGEERVVYERVGILTYSIIIHFPEFVIQNSKGRKHTIKDLYVNIEVQSINPSGYYKCSIGMMGLRTTFTLKEINSSYSHSHLGTHSPGGWTGFCIGENSTLSILKNNLQMELKEEQWYLFFYTLQNYLKWESLEGGPYCQMSAIRFGQQVDATEFYRELGRIIEDSPKEMWGYTENLELIQNSPVYEEFIDKNSKLRKGSVKTSEDLEGVIKEWRNRLPESFKFGKKSINYIIENDVPISDDLSLEREVLDKYTEIVNENLENYNKKLEYERRKKEQGEVGTISLDKHS